jgi:diaminopimelate decarboxylase
MQTQNKTRSSHITSARDTDDWGLLSDQAKDADNHALELKIRDLVGVYSSRDAFDQVIEQMKQAAADTIDGFAIDKTAVVGGLGKVMQADQKRN